MKNNANKKSKIKVILPVLFLILTVLASALFIYFSLFFKKKNIYSTLLISKDESKQFEVKKANKDEIDLDIKFNHQGSLLGEFIYTPEAELFIESKHILNRINLMKNKQYKILDKSIVKKEKQSESFLSLKKQQDLIIPDSLTYKIKNDNNSLYYVLVKLLDQKNSSEENKIIKYGVFPIKINYQNLISIYEGDEANYNLVCTISKLDYKNFSKKTEPRLNRFPNTEFSFYEYLKNIKNINPYYQDNEKGVKVKFKYQAIYKTSKRIDKVIFNENDENINEAFLDLDLNKANLLLEIKIPKTNKNPKNDSDYLVFEKLLNYNLTDKKVEGIEINSLNYILNKVEFPENEKTFNIKNPAKNSNDLYTHLNAFSYLEKIPNSTRIITHNLSLFDILENFNLDYDKLPETDYKIDYQSSFNDNKKFKKLTLNYSFTRKKYNLYFYIDSLDKVVYYPITGNNLINNFDNPFSKFNTYNEKTNSYKFYDPNIYYVNTYEIIDSLLNDEKWFQENEKVFEKGKTNLNIKLKGDLLIKVNLAKYFIFTVNMPDTDFYPYYDITSNKEINYENAKKHHNFNILTIKVKAREFILPKLKNLIFYKQKEKLLPFKINNLLSFDQSKTYFYYDKEFKKPVKFDDKPDEKITHNKIYFKLDKVFINIKILLENSDNNLYNLNKEYKILYDYNYNNQLNYYQNFQAEDIINYTINNESVIKNKNIPISKNGETTLTYLYKLNKFKIKIVNTLFDEGKSFDRRNVLIDKEFKFTETISKYSLSKLIKNDLENNYYSTNKFIPSKLAFINVNNLSFAKDKLFTELIDNLITHETDLNFDKSDNSYKIYLKWDLAKLNIYIKDSYANLNNVNERKKVNGKILLYDRYYQVKMTTDSLDLKDIINLKPANSGQVNYNDYFCFDNIPSNYTNLNLDNVSLNLTNNKIIFNKQKQQHELNLNLIFNRRKFIYDLDLYFGNNFILNYKKDVLSGFIFTDDIISNLKMKVSSVNLYKIILSKITDDNNKYISITEYYNVNGNFDYLNNQSDKKLSLYFNLNESSNNLVKKIETEDYNVNIFFKRSFEHDIPCLYPSSYPEITDHFYDDKSFNFLELNYSPDDFDKERMIYYRSFKIRKDKIFNIKDYEIKNKFINLFFTNYQIDNDLVKGDIVVNSDVNLCLTLFSKKLEVIINKDLEKQDVFKIEFIPKINHNFSFKKQIYYGNKNENDLIFENFNEIKFQDKFGSLFDIELIFTDDKLSENKYFLSMSRFSIADRKNAYFDFLKKLIEYKTTKAKFEFSVIKNKAIVKSAFLFIADNMQEIDDYLDSNFNELSNIFSDNGYEYLDFSIGSHFTDNDYARYIKNDLIFSNSIIKSHYFKIVSDDNFEASKFGNSFNINNINFNFEQKGRIVAKAYLENFAFEDDYKLITKKEIQSIYGKSGYIYIALRNKPNNQKVRLFRKFKDGSFKEEYVKLDDIAHSASNQLTDDNPYYQSLKKLVGPDNYRVSYLKFYDSLNNLFHVIYFKPYREDFFTKDNGNLLFFYFNKDQLMRYFYSYSYSQTDDRFDYFNMYKKFFKIAKMKTSLNYALSIELVFDEY